MKKAFSFTVISALVLLVNMANAQSVFLQQYNNLPLKKIIYTGGNILTTDGNSFYVNDKNGNNIGSANVGLSNSFLLQQAVATPNGTIYCLYQYTSGSTANAGMVILSLDMNLNFRWMQNIYAVGSTFGYGMAPTADNGVMICGTTCSTGFFLLKLNSNGTQQFQKNINISGYCIPYAITSYMNNQFVIATRTETGNDNEVIFVTDSAGNVTGSRSIAFSNLIYVKSVKADASGNIYSLVNESNGASDIVKVASNLTDNSMYNVSSANQSIQLNDIALSGSSVFAVGNINIGGASNLDILTISLNTTTNSILSKTSGSTGYNDAYNVATDNESRYYMSGTNLANGYIAKVDAGITGFCSSNEITLATNQATVTTSDVQYSVNNGPLFNATSLNINSSPVVSAISGFCNYQVLTGGSDNIAEVAAPASNGVVIYPNPANEELNIVTNLTGNNKINYTITDELGRAIMAGTMINGTNKVDINQLSSGEYFVSLISDNQVITKKFIKAQ